MEMERFNRTEDSTVALTSAPGTATHDTELELAGQVAWLGFRYVVGEVPGLHSLKQPYEKVKELMKESNALKKMADGLRIRAEDLRSASREGIAGGPGEDVEDLVKDLETVIADLAPIINMSTTLRVVRQEDLDDTVDHHRIVFKVLERKYRDLHANVLMRELKALRNENRELKEKMEEVQIRLAHMCKMQEDISSYIVKKLSAVEKA